MKARLTAAALLAMAGAAAAVTTAPLSSANPTLPQCVDTGGSAVIGGQTTECSTPGNTQIDATPEQPGYGMFPWEDDFWVL